MALEDIIKEQISIFKELVSEIDDHSDDSKFFRKLSQKAQWIAGDIDKIHSGYYVAFIEVGPDDDFIRIYYPLGFMTEHEARKLLDEELDTNDDSWNENGIFEVSEEKYYEYYELIRVQKFYNYIKENKYKLIDILPPNFIENLDVKINKFRNNLGLTRRWMHVEYRPFREICDEAQ